MTRPSISPYLAPALTVALTLAGCGMDGASRGAARAPLDLTLTRRCDDPAPLPDRDLTERETAGLWGRDRLALRDCARRFGAAISIIEKRDAAISGR